MSGARTALGRLGPEPVDPDELTRFIALAIEIEECVIQQDAEGLAPRLREWNEGANRKYEPVEFKTYSGAMETEEFARAALLPRPSFIHDLRFDEACAAVQAIVRVELSDAETSSVLGTLEVNFPGANLSDLIFWPDVWFDNPQMLDAELTPAQVVGYAAAASGRELVGAPADLELPFPLPPTRAPDPT